MADIDADQSTEMSRSEPNFQGLTFSRAFAVCEAVKAPAIGEGNLGADTIKLNMDGFWPSGEPRLPDLDSPWTRVPIEHPVNANLLAALEFVGGRQHCTFKVNGQDPAGMEWIQWPCHVRAEVNKSSHRS